MSPCPIALFNVLQADLPLTGNEVQQFCCQHMLTHFLSKYTPPSTTDLANAAALQKYRNANDKCRDFDIVTHSEIDEYVDSIMMHRLDAFSCTFPDDPESYDFGPGASNGVKGKSFIQKAGGNLTSTVTSPSLYGIYLEKIRGSAAWLDSERIRRRVLPAYIPMKSNRIEFVPKKTDCSRTIAVEPSLNMFLQKGLGRELEKLLRVNYKLDIENQQFRNRQMACEGSKNGRFATIDLKSASDSVSLKFCRRFLPPVLLQSLELVRCPSSTCGGEEIENFMISTMGNATTFPLQTIIFSTIILACYEAKGIQPVYNTRMHNGNFACFGDDIICLEEAYPLVVHTLRRYGFEINPEKSFSGYSRFRESCGGDYYDGVNVRPVFCTTLSSTRDVYSLINRLVIWSSRHFIELHGTIQYLLSFVKKRLVPLWEDVASGLRSSTPPKSIAPWVYECVRSKPSLFSLNREKDLYKMKMPFLSEKLFYLSFLRGDIRDNRIYSGYTHAGCKTSVTTSVWLYIDRSSSILENVSNGSYRYYCSLYF